MLHENNCWYKFNSKHWRKILQVNIDGITDIGYIREVIITKESIFPIVNTTERPDTVCQALLEGKIAIVVDNTPFVMIIPTFFIDFFIHQMIIIKNH